MTYSQVAVEEKRAAGMVDELRAIATEEIAGAAEFDGAEILDDATAEAIAVGAGVDLVSCAGEFEARACRDLDGAGTGESA